MADQLRWLGECIIRELNLLSVFAIDPESYFTPGSISPEEDKRLRVDLRKNYRKIATQLHPDKLHTFPTDIRKTGEELLKEVNETYELLTEERYYTPPPQNPHYPEFRRPKQHFNIETYVHFLQRNNTPINHPPSDPYFLHTLFFFIKVVKGIGEIKKNIEKEPSEKYKSLITSLEQKLQDTQQELQNTQTLLNEAEARYTRIFKRVEDIAYKTKKTNGGNTP